MMNDEKSCAVVMGEGTVDITLRISLQELFWLLYREWEDFRFTVEDGILCLRVFKDNEVFEYDRAIE